MMDFELSESDSALRVRFRSNFPTIKFLPGSKDLFGLERHVAAGLQKKQLDLGF